MIQYWSIDETLEPQKMILIRYSWSEHGFVLRFRDVIGRRNVQILFDVDLDGVQILFLRNDLEAEDMLYTLMQSAGMDERPFLPSFIQDESDMIATVKKMAGYDAKDRAYLHYTVVTDDFWINVVSCLPPYITISDDK